MSKKEKIRKIQVNIDENNLEFIRENVDQKQLLYSRDKMGKSPLHKAIEKQAFKIALFLLEKCPLLSKINDCVRFSSFFL